MKIIDRWFFQASISFFWEKNLGLKILYKCARFWNGFVEFSLIFSAWVRVILDHHLKWFISGVNIWLSKLKYIHLQKLNFLNWSKCWPVTYPSVATCFNDKKIIGNLDDAKELLSEFVDGNFNLKVLTKHQLVRRYFNIQYKIYLYIINISSLDDAHSLISSNVLIDQLLMIWRGVIFSVEVFIMI